MEKALKIAWVKRIIDDSFLTKCNYEMKMLDHDKLPSFYKITIWLYLLQNAMVFLSEN